jgi:polysaccharide biosynthesis protein PslH
MTRPTVLAITSELPWPLDSGGHLRTFHVQKHLATACDLRLVVPVVGDRSADLTTLESHGIRVIPVPVPDRSKLAEAKRLLNAGLVGEPYIMYRRHARAEVFAAWQRELVAQKPHVTWLDHLDSFLFNATARQHGVRTILDLHNIYSLILERMADEQPNALKKAFFRGEAKRLAKIEQRACVDANTIIAVSSTEADHFRKLGAKSVVVAPNGVDCSTFTTLPCGRPTVPPVVMFLGTMSWGPNVSAAISLARDIFPHVRAKLPNAELLLVGKDPAPEVRAFATQPGVMVTGSVPSIRPYLERASLLAVPLDSGGGTRLKILEAFAAGLPVVSTAVGAEGIDATANELVIAERPVMANAIVELLGDQARANRLAAAARKLAETTYDWPMIGAKCVASVREIA